MKKFKRVVVLALTGIISLSAVTGCSAVTSLLNQEEKLDYSVGAWNESGVFENKSIGMKFELPDNWTSLSQDEMDQMLDGKVGSMTDAQIEDMKKTFNYELIIQNNYQSIQCITEDLERSLKDSTTTEKEYIELIKKQNSSSEDYKLVFEATYTKTIAGKEFVILPVSVNNDTMNQFYALHKEDGYMVQIIATYYPESEDNVMSIIENNFKAL